jgi:hypothetical protein
MCREGRGLSGLFSIASGRGTCYLYEWKIEDVGKDFDLIEQEITAANFYIEAMDVHKLCDEALEDLYNRLSAE